VKVLVDSSVWSLALRRSKVTNSFYLKIFNELLKEGRIEMIGPIRQEILSGIRFEAQFNRLRDKLRGWRDLELQTADFELAAEYFNVCRGKGIQGTHTDFLICAVANSRDLAVLTTDNDFERYATLIPLKLLRAP